MDDVEIFTLEFDDGTTLDCENLGVFTAGGKDYIALVPQDDPEEAYLYGYRETDDGGLELIGLDDEEYEIATAEFYRITDGSEEA